MPPQKTRQLFLDYYSRARGKRASAARKGKQAAQAWNRLSVAERRQFVQARQAVLDAFEALQSPRTRADDASVDAVARRNDGTIDYFEVVFAANTAAVKYERLLPLQQTYVDRLGALRTFISSLATARFEDRMHAQVRAYAIGEHIRGQAELNRIMTERDRLRRDANYPPVPRRADGRYKMPEALIVETREGMRNAARRMAFKSSVPAGASPNERWEGAWMIPGGGMSITGLWVQLDQHGLVKKRTLRKDAYLDKEQWASAVWFDGDLRDTSNRQPFEIACHSAVHTIPATGGNINVPQLIAWNVNDVKMVYTMYLEWCPFGDMDDLIRTYQQTRADEDGTAHIPEPAIWYFFYCLAEVGLAMEEGTTKYEVAEDWKQIVHNDLKPSNVFLAGETQGHCDDYLTPKLGDFGLAFKTWSGDPLNPQIFRDGIGTLGWLAPETRSYVDRETLGPIDRFQMLAHTNVYGIGLIIYSLMSLEDDPEQLEWLGDEESAHDVRAHAKWNYSTELTRLVQRCIRFRPSNRPTFEDILECIVECTDESGLDLAQGMWHPASADQNQRNTANQLSYYMPADRYRLGLALNQLPADRGA